METFTYGDIVIRQKGNEPSPGDQVENKGNTQISITINGKKKSFEVRDGKIKREVKAISIERVLIGVIFIVMMIFMLYLFGLWGNYR